MGGIIGIEREYRDKSAGFRTMILIATSAALFTIMSEVAGDSAVNQMRVVAAVVSGVGFLGAGVIIKDSGSIRGLTTAASIWLVASLGVVTALGFAGVAFTVALGILVVLWILPPFERRIDALHDFVTINVTIRNSDRSEKAVLALFDEAQVRIVHISRSRAVKNERVLHIKVRTRPAKHQALDQLLVNAKTVLQFNTSS